MTMFWRRKKRERGAQGAPVLLTRVAIWINGQLIKCAAYLQRKTMQCSLKKLMVLAGVLCFTSGFFSIYIIISSLKEMSPAFRVTPIQVMPLARDSLPAPVITEKEYHRFRRLRLSLDSLAETPSGKRRLDSILNKHPKLLDTLSLLESIYYNQHKN
jgi:hypothetical protein